MRTIEPIKNTPFKIRVLVHTTVTIMTQDSDLSTQVEQEVSLPLNVIKTAFGAGIWMKDLLGQAETEIMRMIDQHNGEIQLLTSFGPRSQAAFEAYFNKINSLPYMTFPKDEWFLLEDYPEFTARAFRDEHNQRRATFHRMTPEGASVEAISITGF